MLIYIQTTLYLHISYYHFSIWKKYLKRGGYNSINNICLKG